MSALLMRFSISLGGGLKTNRFRSKKLSQLQRNKPTLPLGHTVEGNKLVTLDGFNFERHKHIIGISGSGKSSFIAAIVVLLLRQGISFCLIDPHGDLAKLIISLLIGSDFYNNPRAYDR